MIELREHFAECSPDGVARSAARVAYLSHRRQRSSQKVRRRPAFYFDLACPFSYLAAERVQRALGKVDWIPVSAHEMSDEPWGRLEAACGHAQDRAQALRLPLVWPDRFPAAVPRALRAAGYATEHRAGDRFALAASRLAFCGAFDLEESDVLAEAAAAAGLSIDGCLAAADDPARDSVLWTTAWRLLARGVTRVPALRINSRFVHGEEAIQQLLASAGWQPRPSLTPGSTAAG